MRTLIIFGSFFAVFLLLITSFSSVVAYQTVDAQQKTLVQSFKSDLKQRLMSSMVSKRRSAHLQSSIHTLLNSNVNAGTTQVRSLLARCSTVYDTIANTSTSQRMLVVLVLTILVEFFTYLVTVNAPALVLLFLSVVINALTNPAVNYIYYNIYNNVFVLETLVVIVESFLIFMLFNAASVSIGFANAAFLSLLANLMSYIIATGLTKFLFDVVLPSS